MKRITMSKFLIHGRPKIDRGDGAKSRKKNLLIISRNVRRWYFLSSSTFVLRELTFDWKARLELPCGLNASMCNTECNRDWSSDDFSNTEPFVFFEVIDVDADVNCGPYGSLDSDFAGRGLPRLSFDSSIN